MMMCSSGAAPTLPLSPLTATETSPRIRRAPPTIYATTYRSGTLSCTVTVQNNIGRVTLNKSCMYLESIGAQGALRAKVAVANPETVPITWTSSNTAAAVVDANGNVTAVGDGQAVITATSAEGRCASCKVYTGSVGAQKKKKADSFFSLGGPVPETVPETVRVTACRKTWKTKRWDGHPGKGSARLFLCAKTEKRLFPLSSGKSLC